MFFVGFRYQRRKKHGTNVGGVVELDTTERIAPVQSRREVEGVFFWFGMDGGSLQNKKFEDLYRPFGFSVVLDVVVVQLLEH